MGILTRVTARRITRTGLDGHVGQMPAGGRQEALGVPDRDLLALPMRLADAAGLDAVSMRTVSADMGMSSMALYRYVKSKQELLLMMVDEARGPPPATMAAPGQGWRDGLVAWAHASRQRLRAHPWMLAVPMAEPAILPYQVQWTGMGPRRARGHPARPSRRSSRPCCWSTSMSAARPSSHSGSRPAPTPAPNRAPKPGCCTASACWPWPDPDRYPRVIAAMKADPAASYQSDFGTDEFNFGLSTVLDGIQALVARRVERC